MKYFALLMIFVFALFAGLQYNDPDPVLWIPIYLTAVYASWQAYQGKSNSEMLIVLTLLALAGGINSWLQMTAWEGLNTEDLSMKSVNQELAREALGLWICAVVMVVYWLTSKK